MQFYQKCRQAQRLSEPSSGTIAGRKELRTNFETKIAITFHLFIVQKNFLYHWNLRVIMRVIKVSDLLNFYLGLKYVHIFGQKSDFICYLWITFFALYLVYSSTAWKSDRVSVVSARREYGQSMCIRFIFLLLKESVAKMVF